MTLHHPWQSGPTELLSYAIDHLHRTSEFDQRIAFLLLDIGVETLFKTFLELPEQVTDTKMAYGDRKKAVEGKFHDLIIAMGKAAGPRLQGIDLRHVEFYHGIRNKLYHEGNGITVPTEKARDYAAIAVELLKRLLGVDLKTRLKQPELDLERAARERQAEEEIEHALNRLDHAVGALHSELCSAIEWIEPAFLLPSFERQLAAWQADADPELFHCLERVGPNGPVPPVPVPADLLQSMPAALQRFTSKHRTRPAIVANLALTDSLTEFFLILAEIALHLPSRATHGVLSRATVQRLAFNDPGHEEDALLLADVEESIAQVDRLRALLIDSAKGRGDQATTAADGS